MTCAIKEITVAHSPDSDDAFMFYALAANRLDTQGLKIHQVLKDIQSLNKDAGSGRYEVSAISFAAYPLVSQQYALMPCGASMGLNYGPLVLSRKRISKEDLPKVKIAIPGKLTSAYMVLQLYQSNLDVVELPFDQIVSAIKNGEVDAGLIIHEGQLTYEQAGLVKIVDLGQWWYSLTNGLPLPLGGNIIRKDLGTETIQFVSRLLRNAISYSLEHREEALEYALKYARDLGADQADRFISMYVNELTLDYGDIGRQALHRLFDMAYEKELISAPVELDFVAI